MKMTKLEQKIAIIILMVVMVGIVGIALQFFVYKPNSEQIETLTNEIDSITKEMRKKMVVTFKAFRVPISGLRPISEAIITRGGIPTDEIDPRTMQSKICEGLYFAGEIIDVDGYTGGYNLQIAWSTAFLAGNAVAK